MTDHWPYTLLVLSMTGERVAELVLSIRHARWAFERGGVEYGRRHYPLMVLLHAGLLAGCLVEVQLADRPFIPLLGWPMLGLVIASQALRWWCIATLGPRWNTRVIVIPGRPLVTGGPYAFLRHPNYLAVVVEVAALPMVHTAWVTALLASVANAAILSVRIRVENQALATAVQ